MTMSVKSGGSWSSVVAPYVKDGGVWKAVSVGSVKVSGVWYPFFTGETVTIADEAAYAVAFSPATATASYSLESDGDVVVTGAAASQWISPKSAAPGSYEVRATLNSGSLTSGATGSWLALTSTRTWTVERATTGISSANLTIEIRIGGVVQDTCTVTLTAERDV